MTIPTEQDVARAALGEVRLYVPNDWFDLLETGFDDEAARARITELIRLSYPERDSELRGIFVEAVMTWRMALLQQGTLLHGIVCVPPAEIPGGAAWQVMAGVVNVPPIVADLDLGEVVARLLGDEFKDQQMYTEAYATAMGLGVGAVARPHLDQTGAMVTPDGLPGGSTPREQTTQIGLGIALSCPPSGGYGLLVVGSCLDPDHTAALGSLVGVIAGGSIISASDPFNETTKQTGS
jgi:hypothetical protein